ncbi:MAG: PAS domain-containing protein, partial [Gammaproteobacteria bacterium]|nr:PAS domain-containing protein [Gammaproteobacteria bacterium]
MNSAPDSAPNQPLAGFDSYVVCIGASAGGLDALERFFKQCPADTGAAFVVIQHLSPDHKSMMNNLLARHTSMPVIVVEDDMAIEANHLYLIPPGSVMHVSSGHLHLTPKNPRGLTLPIDIFFHSLADAYGKRAVGVILSGTGSDGARGAVAINAGGGFLMVQAPDSAAFDGMPRSAIATGLVDAILPAEELPLRLAAHIQNRPYKAVDEEPARVIPYARMSTEEVFASIMHLLHQVGGIDFSDYKPNTVMRRIERRQQVRHSPELYQYLDLLENDRNEIITLRRELLISVTSFFRDTETFQELADKVIRPMVQRKQAGESIRVWTSGVATGEEAYSLGMLFLEAFEREKRWPSLKIFATDVDQQCVETAGAGQYPESAAAELSPERLERFFLRKGERFLVRNDLRQCIVFARHNLLADPPFTKMDLVVCRNTLIYFKSIAQERVLRSLQYALVDGGALLLGSSESLTASTEGLQVISARHKLFRRKGPVAPLLLARQLGLMMPHLGKDQSGRSAQGRRQAAGNALADAGLNVLLNRFAPPAILVDENHHAIHLFGDLSPYLRAKEGSASLQIGRLLPDNITPVASALLYKASRDRASLISDLLELRQINGQIQHLRLSAHPVGGPDDERLTLLCFELEQHQQVMDAESLNLDAETVARLSILEQELAATRESLQATIEELETSNEELQATNEELMASNEELQSSNEELQSVNEEMSTVNAEFQEKVLLLNRVNADLDSLAKAAGVATVFVDGDLNITRFSPDASLIFKLRDTDLGRPLDDIAHLLDYPDLMRDLQQTLNLQRTTEREVNSRDGKYIYLVRMLPYQVPSSPERGAVATFVEVTAIHDVRRLQSIIDALPEHIAVLSPDGVIQMVNNAWKRFARANGDPQLAHSGVGANYLEACGSALGEDAGAQSAARGLRQVLEGSLP